MAFGNTYGNQVSEFEAGKYLQLTPSAVQSGYRLLKASMEHETVIRVLPAVDQKTKQIVPWRHRSGPGMFTDWVVPLKVYMGGMDPSFVSFIATMPGNTPGTIMPIGDDTPCDIFYKRVRALTESDAHAPDGTPFSRYAPLLKGSAGRSAAISKPKLCAFVHCIRLYHGGENHTNKDPGQNLRYVFMFSHSGRIGLQDLCNQEVPDWKNKGIDPESLDRYVIGDWLGFQPDANGNIPGHALKIATRKLNRRANNQSAGPISFDGSAPVPMGGMSGMSGDSGKDPNENNYECSLAMPLPIPQAWAVQLYRPWEDTLQLFSPEQQVEKLLSVGYPVSLVVRAFEAQAQWLPESVKAGRVISGPVSTVAPNPLNMGSFNGGVQGVPAPAAPASQGMSFGGVLPPAMPQATGPATIPMGNPSVLMNAAQAPVGVQPTGQPVNPVNDPAAADNSSAALERLRNARNAASVPV